MWNFNPQISLKDVTDITPAFLEKHGIKALALDVDNTLTTHDNPHPVPEIQHWLDSMKAAGIPMVIVSNNSAARVEPFAKILDLPFIADAAKPKGKGFRQATKRFGIRPRELGVVGDQVFTDILGGNLFGAVSILITPLGPETKNFIKFKRVLERPALLGYKGRKPWQQ